MFISYGGHHSFQDFLTKGFTWLTSGLKRLQFSMVSEYSALSNQHFQDTINSQYPRTTPPNYGWASPKTQLEFDWSPVFRRQTSRAGRRSAMWRNIRLRFQDGFTYKRRRRTTWRLFISKALVMATSWYTGSLQARERSKLSQVCIYHHSTEVEIAPLK